MISLGEIRNRSHKFAKEWDGATYERGEAQTFWNEFFQIFDISRRRVATFEEPIKKLGGSQGFIDLFWRGQLLIEHKTLAKTLLRLSQGFASLVLENKQKKQGKKQV